MSTTPPLSDAEHALTMRAAGRLRFYRNSAIVVCLLREYHDQNEAEASHYSVETECPLLFEGINYERCEHGSEVRRENDECGPDVDFSGVLMEEVRVLNEHEPTTLRHG
jgi:hypothetical protein